ncbi:hypothetical protein BC830DRAFT_1102255 [Chytriomyces sp. MP71]|nr:hypothetical protein BC830DRAFT_1102255 [Chytriomyces sp. MP71]
MRGAMAETAAAEAGGKGGGAGEEGGGGAGGAHAEAATVAATAKASVVLRCIAIGKPRASPVFDLCLTYSVAAAPSSSLVLGSAAATGTPSSVHEAQLEHRHQQPEADLIQLTKSIAKRIHSSLNKRGATSDNLILFSFIRNDTLPANHREEYSDRIEVLARTAHTFTPTQVVTALPFLKRLDTPSLNALLVTEPSFLAAMPIHIVVAIQVPPTTPLQHALAPPPSAMGKDAAFTSAANTSTLNTNTNPNVTAADKGPHVLITVPTVVVESTPSRSSLFSRTSRRRYRRTPSANTDVGSDSELDASASTFLPTPLFQRKRQASVPPAHSAPATTKTPSQSEYLTSSSFRSTFRKPASITSNGAASSRAPSYASESHADRARAVFDTVRQNTHVDPILGREVRSGGKDATIVATKVSTTTTTVTLPLNKLEDLLNGRLAEDEIPEKTRTTTVMKTISRTNSDSSNRSAYSKLSALYRRKITSTTTAGASNGVIKQSSTDTLVDAPDGDRGPTIVELDKEGNPIPDSVYQQGPSLTQANRALTNRTQRSTQSKASLHQRYGNLYKRSIAGLGVRSASIASSADLFVGSEAGESEVSWAPPDWNDGGFSHFDGALGGASSVTERSEKTHQSVRGGGGASVAESKQESVFSGFSRFSTRFGKTLSLRSYQPEVTSVRPIGTVSSATSKAWPPSAREDGSLSWQKQQYSVSKVAEDDDVVGCMSCFAFLRRRK